MRKQDEKKIISAILADDKYYAELGYDVTNPNDVAEILDTVFDWEDASEDYTKAEIKAAIDAKKSKE